MIPLNETHLRKIVKQWLAHYSRADHNYTTGSRSCPWIGSLKSRRPITLVEFSEG